MKDWVNYIAELLINVEQAEAIAMRNTSLEVVRNF
jgi:hypothetical protein